MVTSKIPRAAIRVLKSISQPPFAKRYNTDRLKYWKIARKKSFNVLKGWVVNVKFSNSCRCLSWRSAKFNKSISYGLEELLD